MSRIDSSPNDKLLKSSHWIVGCAVHTLSDLSRGRLDLWELAVMVGCVDWVVLSPRKVTPTLSKLEMNISFLSFTNYFTQVHI